MSDGQRVDGVAPGVPALLVLLGAAAGMVLAGLHAWQVGSAVLGLAVLSAGALRLALSDAQAGWLAVRSRQVDATLLLLLGAALVTLATTIPDA